MGQKKRTSRRTPHSVGARSTRGPAGRSHIPSAILDVADVMILTLDRKGCITRINPAGVRLLGYERAEDLLGRDWCDTCVPEKVRAEVRGVMTRLFAGELEPVERYENPVRTRSGGERLIAWHNTFVRSPRGSVVSVVSSGIDVTEERRREASLRADAERYHGQFLHLPIPTYVWKVVGDDFELVDFNEAAEVFTRGSVRELVGRRAREYYADVPKILEGLEQCARTRSPIRQELSYHFRSQDLVRELTPVYVFLPPDLVVVHAEDVTERKQALDALAVSEERYRRLFEDSRDAVYVTTRDGTIVSLNDFAVRLFGYDRGELSTLNARDLYDDPQRRREFQDLVERTGSVREFPARLRRKDGSLLDCVLTSSAQRDAGGAVVGYHGTIRDVTEQLRSAEALRASEERYRTLVELSPDAVVVHREGKLEFANDAALRLAGAKSAEELLGRPAMEFVAPQVRALAAERIQLMLVNGEPLPPVEEIFLRLDGSEVPVDVRASPVDWEGAPAVLVVARDISERKEAERRLAESEARLRAAIENAPLIVFAVDREGVFTLSEGRALGAVEMTPGAGVGRRFVDVHGSAAFVARDGATLDAETALRRVLAGETLALTAPMRGRVFTLTIAPNLDSTGRVVGAIGVALDVTERHEAEQALRESERRYREVVDLAPVGIYQSAPGGEFLMVNRRLAEILGYEEVDELRDRNIRDLYHDPPERDRLIAKYEPSGAIADLDVRWRRKDGTTIWIQLDAHAVKDRDGRTRYFEGFVRDVTERKRVEEALRVSEEKFAKAFRASPHSVTITELADGRFVEVNDGFTRIFKHERKAVLGRTSTEMGIYVEPADREKLARPVRERGWVRDVELSAHTASGEVRLVNTSAEKVVINGIPHMVVVATDVTEQRHAENAIRESREALRQLARRLEEVREAERARVSREVHDELGQTLTALNIDLTMLRSRMPESEPKLRERADEMAMLIERMIGTVRRIATELRPGVLDDMGLAAAVEWAVQDFKSRTEMACEATIVGGEREVASGPAVAMFRILQEALTNVARHSGATAVEVTLDLRAAAAMLTVRDNGRGIDVGATAGRPALGLLGMRERAMAFGGAVSVEAAPQGGTVVHAAIPIAGGGER